MNKKRLSGFILTLVMSGISSGVSFATESASPITNQRGTASDSGKIAIREVPKTGGWSKFGVLSAKERALFNNAMADIVEVHYEPLAVRKQVVAGMNYNFFCNARVMVPGSEWYPVMVHIYKPLQGKAVVNIGRTEKL